MSKNFREFRKRMKRVAITSTALTAMLATMVVSAQEVATTNHAVNFRDAAGMDSNIMETLPKGTKVNVLDDSTNWVQVEYNGKTGYVYKTYLETKTVKVGTVKVGDSRLNVRQKPSMSGKIIGKLYNGNKVEIKGESGNWYEIEYKGKTAYVSKKYVKTSSTTISEIEECSDTFKAETGFNVRTGPSTSKAKMGRIIKGQVFQVKGKCQNGWYLIQYGSKEGYISPMYLEEMEDGATDPQVIGTAKVDTRSNTKKNLYIRAGQSADTTALDKAPTGTILEVLEDEHPVNGWTRVRYNNLTGYVYTDYLVIDKDTPENPDTPDQPTEENEAPVIECVDELTYTVGDDFAMTDLRLEVTDKEDGNIADKANVDTSKLDLSKAGEYVITITVKDSDGAEASKDVKVIVKDKETPEQPEENEKPVISSVDELTYTVGDEFAMTDLRLEVTDKEDGNIADKAIVDTSKVDMSKAGEYIITISIKDSDGAEVTKDVKVTVKDKETPVQPEENEAPVIKSVDELTYTVGDSFAMTDLQLEVTDKEDGNITDKAVVDTSKLDLNTSGEYIITITVKDSKDAKVTKDVKVTVKDKETPEVKNEAPVIKSVNELTYTVGDSLNITDLQLEVTDAEDGNLADKAVIDDSQVDFTKAGEYTITISVEDSKGEKASKDVKVTIKEKEVKNEAPVISSEDELTYTVGDEFVMTDLNLKVTDAEDGDITDKAIVDVTNVDTTKAGEYTITISVEDSKGEKASKAVKVVVKEAEVKNTAPEITASDVTITVGDSFSKDLLNIKATDAEDGDLTDKVEISGDVNATKAGEYTLTLTVKDSKGEEAKTTVKVTVKEKEKENTAPVLTVSDLTIDCGDNFKYSMLNAKAEDAEDGTITDFDYSGDVDSTKVGEYKVKVTVKDSQGLTDSKTVKVTVKSTKPVITAEDATITVGDDFSSGTINASAKDCEGNKIDVDVPATAVNTTKAGTYDVKVSATDKWGNTATKTVQVTVKEKEVQGYKVNSPECRRIIQDEMYRLVNEHRANNGRDALTVSSALENTAYLKSEDMGINNYFDHQVDGKFIWEYKDCADADAENIAKCGCYGSNGKMTEEQCKKLANSIFNMWKESTGHNANMLSKKNQVIGFDLYLVDRGNDAYTVYATQEFRTK